MFYETGNSHKELLVLKLSTRVFNVWDNSAVARTRSSMFEGELWVNVIAAIVHLYQRKDAKYLNVHWNEVFRKIKKETEDIISDELLT